VREPERPEQHHAAPDSELHNIARIYDTKLGDRPLASNFYRRYITGAGAVADRIQLANQLLVALREAELAANQSAPVASGRPPRPRERHLLEHAAGPDPN